MSLRQYQCNSSASPHIGDICICICICVCTYLHLQIYFCPICSPVTERVSRGYFTISAPAVHLHILVVFVFVFVSVFVFVFVFVSVSL